MASGLILENVRAQLDEEQLRARSVGERLAYAVTRAAGTTTYPAASRRASEGESRTK